MGFELQATAGTRRKHYTYTDETIDKIYKTKTSLKIDVETELETLRNLKKNLEADYEKARNWRDSITDWDSDESYQAEEACDELFEKIDSLDDWIDSLEDLNSVL